VLPIRDENPTRRPAVVTWLIVLLAAGVYLVVQPHSGSDGTRFLYEQATIPCEVLSGHPLTIEEITSGTCDDVPGPELAPHKNVYLSLVVSVFLHGSLLHLVGNLWILWIFGNNVEDDLGSLGFLVFYLAAGIVASIAHVLIHSSDTIPVVGASGAIAGVMGAYLVLHPWARVVSIVPPLFFLPFRVPAALFLVIWFVLQFALANTDTNIAWEAHVAGFAFGVVIAIWLRSTGLISRRRAR
jgi:membrane associated rhomboid family serine protease